MHNTMMDVISDYLGALGVHAGFKASWSFVFLVLSAALGGVGTLAVLLVTIMVLDYILGFCRAWCTCTISGKKMREGIVKFILYATGVVVVSIADASVAETLRPLLRMLEYIGVYVQNPVRSLYMCWLVSHEALSCIKHLESFGLPVPHWLRIRLVSYRDVVGAAALAGIRR